MHIDFMLEKFREHADRQGLIWNGKTYSFSHLLQLIDEWQVRLEKDEISPGTVVCLEGDFSPNSVAAFLTLVEKNCIIVPQSNLNKAGRERKDEISQIQHIYQIDAEDRIESHYLRKEANHLLYEQLRKSESPGLVLFSSGTSGDPKAAVHNFLYLLEKFKVKRPAIPTLNFLLFDHWGGLNTLFHTLANGALVITVRDRAPESVCKLIEAHKVELLPTTPTFLNLLLLSRANEKFDLSSLKVISYGAEPMPQNTLDRLKLAFPKIKLQQTYGLIELGVMRSKSREDGSLWVKIGGEGFETRVVDGILQIKSKSTILGYLNAPTPITEDGWFITGDAVYQDGEYMRILGRKSELINVGGEKVFPAEVENVIQGMDNIEDVTVYGEKNPLIGNIVCAKIKLVQPRDSKEFIAELKSYCHQRMEKFKVPVKVQIVDADQYGDRFKKMRASQKEAR